MGSISLADEAMHASGDLAGTASASFSDREASSSSNANVAKSAIPLIANHQLPPKLNIYSATANYNNPQVLVQGDLIITFKDLPGTILPF